MENDIAAPPDAYPIYVDQETVWEVHRAMQATAGTPTAVVRTGAALLTRVATALHQLPPDEIVELHGGGRVLARLWLAGPQLHVTVAEEDLDG